MFGMTNTHGPCVRNETLLRTLHAYHSNDLDKNKIKYERCFLHGIPPNVEVIESRDNKETFRMRAKRRNSPEYLERAIRIETAMVIE